MRLLGAVALAALLGTACSREESTQAQAGPPPAPAPTPSPDHSALVSAVDGLAEEALQRGGIAGLSIAVFRGGEPILAKGYGYADREAGRPADADTSYPIASVTKMFTSAAILRLADQGRLGLDDTLHTFFPQARAAIGKLTLRQLLNHTSGLTRGGPAPRHAAESVIRRGGTAMAANLRWDYSNYNFSLLGLVLEKVSGRPYAQYMRDELTGPLGLDHTGYCEDGSPIPGRTVDYETGPHGPQPTVYWHTERFFSSGGLCASVLDLVRWERALDDGRVLKPESLKAMRTPTRLSDGQEVDYGFGLRLGWTAGQRKVGHTGGGRSNKAALARYPDQDLTVAVLLNTERTGTATVAATDVEAAVGRLVFDAREADPPVPLPASDLVRYTGQYRDGGRLMRIVSDQGALKLRVGPGRRDISELVAQGGDVFVDGEEPSLHLRFQMDGDKARGYARYHNGWFVGAGVRSADVAPQTRAASPRRKRAPRPAAAPAP